MNDIATEPIVKNVTVGLSIDEAFRLFTVGMGKWWPLETHSIAADSHEGRLKAESLVFEEREGGRIYEMMSDGSEGDWGQVLIWEPPTRVAFSWKPSLTDDPHTEVEVRFTSTGEATDVQLEHRGWERLGLGGIDKRKGYNSGWPAVLDLFRKSA
jgi:uncharacterized protein YndB with AHSA1/START domain